MRDIMHCNNITTFDLRWFSKQLRDSAYSNVCWTYSDMIVVIRTFAGQWNRDLYVVSHCTILHKVAKMRDIAISFFVMNQGQIPQNVHNHIWVARTGLLAHHASWQWRSTHEWSAISSSSSTPGGEKKWKRERNNIGVGDTSWHSTSMLSMLNLNSLSLSSQFLKWTSEPCGAHVI